MIHLQLRNDAIFQQHVQVSGELRRHLEENAAGEVFVSVAANDVDPLQSSPLADSPVASSYVASRSLEASGTYMAPLRFTLLVLCAPAFPTTCHQVRPQPIQYRRCA